MDPTYLVTLSIQQGCTTRHTTMRADAPDAFRAREIVCGTLRRDLGVDQFTVEEVRRARA